MPKRALRFGALVLLVLSVLAMHAWLLGVALPGPEAGPARAGVRVIEARRIEPAPLKTEVAAAEPATGTSKPAPRVASKSAPRPPSVAAKAPVPAAAAPTLARIPDQAAPTTQLPWPTGAGTGASDTAPTYLGGRDEVPVYPTRIPASTSLSYELRRGDRATGSARLHWRHDGEHYELQFETTLPGRPPIEHLSLGGFDEAGLAPLRFADRRRGRDVRAANFQRAAGKISFSAVTHEFEWAAGVQDRLSWIAQLNAIVAADPERWRSGQRLSMVVVGTRGAADVWNFSVQGHEVLDLAGRPAPAMRLSRAPSRPYDPMVEVWLSAQHGWWPVHLRQTIQPLGDTL